MSRILDTARRMVDAQQLVTGDDTLYRQGRRSGGGSACTKMAAGTSTST